MGDPLGISRVSSQTKNREGMVGAQIGQYHAMVESSPGCGRGLSRIFVFMIRTVHTMNHTVNIISAKNKLKVRSFSQFIVANA
ncbi:unnamed protein product [Malus baccata var. baccata]